MLQRGVLWVSASSLLVLVLTPCAMAAATADVECAVRTFYKVYVKLSIGGIPLLRQANACRLRKRLLHVS